jgi:hypothetical protein
VQSMHLSWTNALSGNESLCVARNKERATITCVGYVVDLSLSLNLITNSNEEQVHAWAI